MCTWEDVTTAPDTDRLLETVRALLDPATLATIRSDNLDSSIPALCDPPTPPPTPSPTRSGTLAISFQLANPVDVNENDQEPIESRAKVKRVTFAPDIMIEPVDTESGAEDVPSDAPNPPPSVVNDSDLVVGVQVSWNDLFISHGALIVVLLTAVAFYHWLPVGQ